MKSQLATLAAGRRSTEWRFDGERFPIAVMQRHLLGNFATKFKNLFEEKSPGYQVKCS